MTRKEKVLAIIAQKKDDQIRFLALRNNPADPAHGGDFFYVVTGNVDKDEALLETILREVDEETGIRRVLNIAILPVERDFRDGRGRLCHETFFAIVTDQEVEHLSEEHIEHAWLKRDDFLSTIRWYGSGDELAGLLDYIEKIIFSD